MSTSNLFDLLGMTTQLTAFDKKIPKKQLYIHGELTAAERDLIVERVDEMRIKYVLNDYTYPMEIIKSEQEQYDLILFAEVKLKTIQATERLSRLIQETIPSPLVIVYSADNKIQLCTALKRLNQNDRSAVVVQEYHTGNWINLSSLTSAQEIFLNSIRLGTIPSLDYKQAYTHIHQKVYVERYASVINNVETADFEQVKQETEQRLATLNEIEQLKKLLNAKTTSLRDKVKLAGEIKRLESKC